MKENIIYPLVLFSLLLSGCAGQNSSISTSSLAASISKISPQVVLIGETEYVTILKPEPLRIAARVDTGATTSSIGASAIQEYERDGKKWVKFTIADPQTKKNIQLTRPVERTIEVKRHGMDAQKRLVVRLPIAMGSIEQKTEFSLADRSTFKYPVLLGRSFLRGVAVVDVSQKYLLSPLGDQVDGK